MRYGILADTHNRVLPSLFEALADVEEIFHAGDICREDVLAEIATLAPVVAVYGNCDEWPLVQKLPAERRIEREGVSIAVVHGHQARRGHVDRLAERYGSVPGGPGPGRGTVPGVVGSGRGTAPAQGGPPPDLVVFGHSHEPCDAVRGATRFFNPGTAGGVGGPPTVGILTIVEGRLELEHISLLPGP